MVGGGPLDGVRMLVDPAAYKVTAMARHTDQTAIYVREDQTARFAFQGFQDDLEDED